MAGEAILVPCPYTVVYHALLGPGIGGEEEGRMRSGDRRAAVLLALALASGLSCDSLENRLQTCRDLRVELLNALPSEGAVHIARDGEGLNETTLLPAVPGGSTRSISVCVERGDRQRFVAAYGNTIVDTATCVVSRGADALESATSRVAWRSQGLLCEGW
jgi:hypothetical protein